MTLADTLKQQALDGAALSRDASLEALRTLARKQLSEQPFPGRKTEQWKYTSLAALEGGHLAHAAEGSASHNIPDFNAVQLIVRNGELQSTPALPAGVQLRPMTPADAGDALGNVFRIFNAATLNQGWVLEIAPGTQIEQALHLVIVTDSESPASASNRVKVTLGESSKLNLVEQYLGRGPALCSSVVTMHVGANAALTHYRLQTESADSLHISSSEIFQQRDSRVASYQLMTGNRLRRNELRVWMNEPGAELSLRGAFLARESSHIDNQICIEHAAPHCHSDQIFKGIAGETATSVFNGRIHIHPGAKGTDAQLANNNLLLSNGAEIDSKPELEIYNDDVKCSHGCTVGQMDSQQLFYLRARGISEADAKRMLGIGFINELLLSLPDEQIAEWARQQLSASL